MHSFMHKVFIGFTFYTELELETATSNVSDI